MIETMRAAGIGTSVYYPVPIPLSAYYRTKDGVTPAQFPHAARISDQSIALPVGPHLDESDMQLVAGALAHAIEVAR